MALSFNSDRSTQLQTSFQNLSAASKMLNDISNAFGEATAALDEALIKLNPGVEAWVTVSSASDEDTPWEIDLEKLGYSKRSGRWGLTLWTASIDDRGGLEETTGLWLFNDGPRDLRLRAIDHVPQLIEALAKEVSQAAKLVVDKTNTAQEIARSIIALAGKGKR